MTAPIFLNPAEHSRLVKLTGMFGSDYAAERASAAMMATKLLESVGTNWADLMASLPVQSSPRYLTLPETRRAATKMQVSS